MGIKKVMVRYLIACVALKSRLELPAGAAVRPCQTEGKPLIFILRSLLTLPMDRLCTHRALRSDLNICKNLPTDMGKYHKIPWPVLIPEMSNESCNRHCCKKEKHVSLVYTNIFIQDNTLEKLHSNRDALIWLVTKWKWYIQGGRRLWKPIKSTSIAIQHCKIINYTDNAMH